MRSHDAIDAEQKQEAADFHRGLKDRHVQLIALGGAIGASMRYLTNVGVMRWIGPGFPFVYASPRNVL